MTMGIERDVCKGVYWTNMKAEGPYGAVVAHTNFIPHERYGEHIVYLASYFTGTVPARLDQKMKEDFCLRFDLKENEIHWSRMTVDPWAGPIYTTGYRSLIPAYEKHGIYLAGMFSEENYPGKKHGRLYQGRQPDCRLHPGEGTLMAVPEITAIIPVYNDRPALEHAIPESLKVLSTITEHFEVIVAEDGSSDGSAEFVQEYETKSTLRETAALRHPSGKGEGTQQGNKQAQGSIVCYYDVDLATDMQHLPELIDAIRKGADISTGSRLLPESDIRRTEGREIASRSYNFLVRLILGSSIFDHQCGFKAFNKAKILPVLSTVRSNHWFWDTELLVRAQMNWI